MKMVQICGLVLAFAMATILIGCGAPTTDEIKIQALREFNAGQYEKCRPKLQVVLDSHPTDADCLYATARILHMEGQLDRAIFYYRCCLDAAPGYPLAASYLKLAQLDADVQNVINTTTAPAD